ncbi:MAG: biotin transporter BioY [Eubacteriales bacterium]|nr:biotin transporter BioY [Eubacteriales bacterium]
MQNKTRDMILCAIFSAVICVCSIIAIPVWAIPITLGTFGVMVASSVLGVKRGTLSVVVFVLLGAIGIPVFSGFRGGLSVLTGVTGGYITGYLFMPLLSGRAKNCGIIKGCIYNMLAVVICYVFGTAQYIYLTGTNIIAALMMCVVPFIGFDIIKAIVATLFAIQIRKKCKL